LTDKLLIGLDAGTTALKGILIDEEGNIVSIAAVEYELEYPGPDLCEVNPDVYWNSTVEVIRSLINKSNCNPGNIRALAFSSQGETLICVDKNGHPVRKAMVWLDNRSMSEAESIKNAFGVEKLLLITGQPEILPISTASKILWLNKHESSLFTRIHKFQLVEDHLVSRLTGRYFTNACMATSTLYFDIHRQIWWPDMLSFLGISEDKLPGILIPGQVVGELKEEAARVTGLDKSTLVVTGAYDHSSGAVGAGNIHEGMVTETTGTSMAMVVTIDKPILNKKLNLPCHCHAIPGKYYLLPYGQTAGMVLKWFRDEFFGEEKQTETSRHKYTFEAMTDLAAKVPPGSDGLTMLPHLMGAGSPEFDVNVKGVFAGLTPGMKKGHFIRAIMEAVACMVNRNLESLKNNQIKIKEIRALGGGSVSDLWNQIKADMSGIPYITTRSSEAACMGAAILAGAGSGVFSSIEDGCTKLVTIKKKYLADPAKYEKYQEIYRRYVKLYEHMKGWPWKNYQHSTL